MALVSGCSSNTYKIKVDAITKADASNRDAQSYRIKSKNPALGEENLRYKEAADLVKTALSGKGMYEAGSDDQADMIVELDYGMEAPRSKVGRVSVPVYAQVGGGVRYDQVPVKDVRGNTTMRTVAVYESPRNELVGYDKMAKRVTIYEKYLRITARENKVMSEGRPAAELWSIQASTEDESKDLRKYLPIMASATMDMIGQDSTNQKEIKVRKDGPGVEFLRRGISESDDASAK
jgi:hypothetical protein